MDWISLKAPLHFASRVGRKVLPDRAYVWCKFTFGLLLWKTIGGANPPHGVKAQCLRKFGKTYNLQYLVETGTYRGDMIAALKDDFKEIYSIELAEDLY